MKKRLTPSRGEQGDVYTVSVGVLSAVKMLEDLHTRKIPFISLFCILDIMLLRHSFKSFQLSKFCLYQLMPNSKVILNYIIQN